MKRAGRRALAARLVTAWVLVSAPVAGRADEALVLATKGRAASLDPLSPPTLPSLTHADALLDLDDTYAGVGQESFGQSLTTILSVRAEVPLTTRAWQAGIAWDLASTVAPRFGRALVYGNPELWIRGVGWHDSGLSAGGGLGVVVPLPRERGYEDSDTPRFTNAADEATQAQLDVVRVLRAWDSGYFERDTITLRPYFDARLVLDPFVLQLRQGLDWSYSFVRARGDIRGRWGTYVGIAPVSFVTLGVELWQAYAFTNALLDDKRASFSLIPSVRFRVGIVQPGISVAFPISTPLEGIATAYLAVRAHVQLALGKTAAVTFSQ